MNALTSRSSLALLAATGGWAIALSIVFKTIADETMHLIQCRSESV
ncbi:hypothetical protein [Pseudolabrys sp. FHR47]|nr:hypothetical protein [Pseudolabrys sp. FHR47]